jgi:transketolase
MINPDIHLNPQWLTDAKKSTREGFGEALVALGKTNPSVVVLTADLTESTKVDQYQHVYPDRFIEIGIAEQNLAGVAAGLAATGWIPVCSSYAVFNPGRNWEQIRSSIAYSQTNVKIVGSHAGLSVGPDGATHQALEDLAITQVLPNMCVMSPCDYEQAKKSIIACVEHQGPVYLRLSRDVSHSLTTPTTPYEFGKAQVLRFGTKCTLISTGIVVAECLKAANELDAEVINVHTIKPLDENTIIESAKKTHNVLVVEEHQMIGGLGSRVAQVLGEKLPTPIKCIGVQDRFGQSGTTAELFNEYGLTWEHILATAKKFLT